ncbi:glutamine cyclotransferase [Cryptosporidium canis]|uniref:Glutamine cyclotransferase n=1 Tax=Cryptosporidium canis TaxID=195482 RepID=A0ABQ8P3F4_9CRYT|nr:glutamine cyclotransferase [Cryptosporidium canis]KAJ1606280.1 glutamine cyclotransferase [Cryptosporidium canis]
MSGPTASEQQDGGVESQIAILKERLSAYAPKLAPAPKIGKVDTSKNGACISEDCSSEKNCDICNTKTSSLFYWADFDYCPKTRRVTLKKPLCTSSSVSRFPLQYRCWQGKLAGRLEYSMAVGPGLPPAPA